MHRRGSPATTSFVHHLVVPSEASQCVTFTNIAMAHYSRYDSTLHISCMMCENSTPWFALHSERLVSRTSKLLWHDLTQVWLYMRPIFQLALNVETSMLRASQSRALKWRGSNLHAMPVPEAGLKVKDATTCYLQHLLRNVLCRHLRETKLSGIQAERQSTQRYMIAALCQIR